MYSISFQKIFKKSPRNFKEMFLGLLEHYRTETFKLVEAEEQIKKARARK
jgi:hypothetical protein